MKVLTVTIPVYNTEKYIKRCLESILIDEILEDIEVIAVNDGSKDKSLEIMNEFKNKFPNTVKVINKENGGHGSTINVGIKEATGKYFKVIDSDDWVDSLNFISFVKKLKKSDEDVIVSAYTEEYTYSGISKPYEYLKQKENKTIKVENIKYNNIFEIYFPMAAATYKVEVLKKCKMELFENKFYVDMQYNIMPVPYIKTVKFLNDHIYRYFIGRPAQSMSQENLTKNYLHHKEVLLFLVKYYNKHINKLNQFQNEYMEFMVVSMFYTFFNIVCVQMKNKKKSYKIIKEIDKEIKDINIEIYKKMNIYSCIKYSRKLKFINVRISTKIFMKILESIKKGLKK